MAKSYYSINIKNVRKTLLVWDLDLIDFLAVVKKGSKLNNSFGHTGPCTVQLLYNVHYRYL